MSVPPPASQLPENPGSRRPPVNPRAAQSLLATTGWAPRRRPTHAEPGWYPDPARGEKLRFYDGNGWTARVRTPVPAGRRKLPAAALALQSKFLNLADAQAANSRSGHHWRNPAPVISAPQTISTPLNLAVRTRAGRVGGMVSIAAILAGISLASMVGWQHWLAEGYAERAQEELRASLVEQMGEPLVEYDTSSPAPFEIPAEVAATPAPSTTTARPTTSPAPSSPPAPVVRSDLRPWPPRGWSAPANRTHRAVSEFRTGAAVGRIVIPRMQVDEVLISGTGNNELARGIGVAQWGSLPAMPGNATLAGHRTGYGDPLRHVDKLQYGDQIIIEVPGEPRAVYEVRGSMIVRPHETQVTKQTDGVRLTLTTCHPPGSTGYRYVVQAEMVQGAWLDHSVNRGSWRLTRR